MSLAACCPTTMTGGSDSFLCFNRITTFIPDYLQDLLNARNTEVNCLEEHVHSLELKLADVEDLREEVDRLREELKRSDSEHLFLRLELERKELELHESNLHREKLRELISSMSLDSQCEIESMKLDLMALEHGCFEATKIQEETVEEKARMNGLILELEIRFQDAQKIIEGLEEENKELKEKLDTSMRNTRVFCQGIEEWLQNKDRSHQKSQTCLSKPKNKLSLLEEMRYIAIVFVSTINLYVIHVQNSYVLKVLL